jgi:hypothetical protein
VAAFPTLLSKSVPEHEGRNMAGAPRRAKRFARANDAPLFRHNIARTLPPFRSWRRTELWARW